MRETIFKSQQRDPVKFWDRIKGLFGFRCKSHIKPPFKDDWEHFCIRRLGHYGRHTDGDLSWGYGDDYFA